MCTLSQSLVNQGIEQGIERGTANGAKGIIEVCKKCILQIATF